MFASGESTAFGVRTRSRAKAAKEVGLNSLKNFQFSCKSGSFRSTKFFHPHRHISRPGASETTRSCLVRERVTQWLHMIPNILSGAITESFAMGFMVVGSEPMMIQISLTLPPGLRASEPRAECNLQASFSVE